MNRSGYTEGEEDNWQWIKWRGAVASAIRGKRGQAFIRDLKTALEAMPDKKLIEKELMNTEGDVCAIGCIMKARGIDTATLDVDDYEHIAHLLGVNEKLVQEIEWENDNARVFRVGPYVGSGRAALTFLDTAPETRWRILHNWCERNLQNDRGGASDAG
jgi:hypothetical protein